MSDSHSVPSRILIPLDTSRLSEGKIPYGEAQARAFGAEVLLLHVLPTSPPNTGRVSVAESQALSYLNAIAAHLRASGVEAHSLVRYGSVPEVIVRESELQEADLVIIGANIRRGLPQLLTGNIANDVIARSPCPVLVVPPNPAEVEKPLPMRSFDEDVARTGPVSPRELGLRTVALERIVGSVGRASELDNKFRVRNPQPGEQARYARVRKLMEDGAPVPPIVLYKLGYGYYVLDGNHRVAAAKEIGQLDIEAEVTEFVPLEDPQSQRVFVERRAFEQITGLNRVGAAAPGTYPRLEAMIRKYARQQGMDDLREAAHMWEAKVYRPVARRIRALRFGHHFPDQRTADVFIRIADFRDQQMASGSDQMEWEEALFRFREKYSANGLRSG